ncbi:MAG: hypothetical protein J7M38_00290 [Armatimonadetes bacterium]|nr:hypothetical protein [Armatimonadota bacterium]
MIKMELDELDDGRVKQELASQLGWRDCDLARTVERFTAAKSLLSHEIKGVLAEAVGIFGPERALAIFEREDLRQLGPLIRGMRQLVSPWTPLYTFYELGVLLDGFRSYLWRNHDPIISTGHPRTEFHGSLWLDWHLARLYYVKRPVALIGSDWTNAMRRVVGLGPPQYDNAGDVIYDYLWAHKPPRLPFKIVPSPVELETNNSSLSFRTPQTAYDLAEPRTSLFFPDKAAFCSYEDAGILLGVTLSEANWLTEMRPRLFKLRLRVLDELRRCIGNGEHIGLRRQFVDLVLEELATDELSKLLNIDNRFGARPTDGPPLWYFALPGAYDNNSGLTELISVVGHVEWELCDGNHHRVRTELADVVGEAAITSYLQAIDQPWRKTLDNLLWRFMAGNLAEADHRKEFHSYLDDFLWATPTTVVETRLCVPQDQADRYAAMVEPCAREIAQTLADGAPVPSTVAFGAYKADPDICLFCNEGDHWLLSFEGKRCTVKDLKGLHHIHALLARPNVELSSLELVRRAASPAVEVAPRIARQLTPSEARDEGLYSTELDAPIYDCEGLTLEELNSAIAELAEKKQSLSERGEHDAAADVSDRIEKLKREKTRRIGLGGKRRALVSVREKARKSVLTNISRAIKRIEEHHPILAAHLRKAVRTGNKCVYDPSPASIEWRLTPESAML